MNVAEAPEYMAYYGTHVFSNSYEQPSWYMPANDNAEDSGPWYQKDNIVEAMQPCAADRHVSYRSDLRSSVICGHIREPVHTDVKFATIPSPTVPRWQNTDAFTRERSHTLAESVTCDSHSPAT
ncbi:uncharacterized protein [Ptychodera flava]|uniref:uncharacterized protein isoform X2 n=1 Tax=Ptychodera flava TaxID=63121 RepID=UPI003969CBB3